MDLHTRYKYFATADLSILRFADNVCENNPFPFLHRLVQYYDSKIMDNSLSIKELETFRMVLCYEYQLLFVSKKNKIHRKTVADDLCFKTIENLIYLKMECQNFTELEVIYDIMLLHIILYCNSKCMKEHFEYIQDGNVQFFANNISRVLYMKVSQCFLEALRLRQYLYNDIKLDALKHFATLFTEDVVIWLELKENKEWQSFASFFPKLLSTFSSEDVLPIVWDAVLNKVQDLKDLLSVLSIITDVCFPSESKDKEPVYYHLCYTEELWLLLIRNLKSPVKQYRKQALFIMKRLTDFMSDMDETILELEKPKIVPFVCKNKTEMEIPIINIKEKFYLIMEALEEKQYHLIVPALTHVPKLVKGNKEHGSCNDCFNEAWLHLIFERMFHHENHIVIKLGVLYVCELYTIIFDYQFLKLFVHVLNHTFLYECKFYQHEPEILNDLITLFIHAREEQTEFITRLLTIMNEITWAPIPMFYMMLILRIVSSKTSNQWEGHEKIKANSLIQKNLSMHSYILRIASQIELLKTISLSMQKIHNLETVVDILLEFPPEEALVRGSFSWNIITTWFRNALKVKYATNFVKVMCEEYFSGEMHLKINPAQFIVVISMLYDAGLILQNKTCPAEKILNNWMSSLNKISTRPYANILQAFYVTEAMSHFLELITGGCNNSINQLILLQIDNALKFLLKICSTVPSKFSYDEVNRYLAVVDSFLSKGKLILPEKDIILYAEDFKHESIDILQNMTKYTNLHYMCALHILYCTQNILIVNSISVFYVQPLLDIYSIEVVDNDQDPITSKGRIASDCYLLLTKLTEQLLSQVEINLWPVDINWLENISHLYEKGGNEIVPEIALVLKTVVEKGLINDPENRLNFETIFATCWRTTLSNTKNKVYFTAIKNLLGVILNSNFLVLSNTLDFVKHIINQLLKESENAPKLKKILLNKLKLLDVCFLKNLQEPLALCLLHGHVLRKDKQIEYQAYLYIMKNYKDYYPEHISVIDYDNDANIRALSVMLLHKLISENEQHASEFLSIITQKLEKYKNKRYFNHSSIHKIKHRIMQVLLILQPILDKTNSATLQELLCYLMLLESNQPSVRLLQEWILIRIFAKYVMFQYKLWDFFEEAITTRPGCINSVVCIVYHVSKLIAQENRRNFISVGIQYIARCCLGQQYNMRLYSQVIFIKLYEMLEKMECNDVAIEYRGLYEATLNSVKDGHFMKHANRILNDFYLSNFHPVDDYNLETIYLELPRLTDMDATEWITLDIFKALNFMENSKHPLQLQNSNRSLSEIQTSIYLTRFTGETDSLKNHSFPEMKNFEELGDIQKKIDPSSPSHYAQNDIHSTIRESIYSKKMLTEEGIILVASFIDRAPNLGGLARTCEIFNVKELVIANSNVVRDKEFQNLSVSAEKWITVTEVKPSEVGKYILDKKNAGWRLIGVEQTANSTSLLNMKFEKNTILVLGNEKDGIPANLIPLFDTCIEIPQLGIIRSLNVHVSGAICIWEYVKQHSLT